MAYQKKLPPLLLKLNKEDFNKLLEYLINNESNSIEVKAIRDKLLKYSIPFKENNTDLIDIRFYINEGVKLLTLFINNINVKAVSADYYEVVVKLKENFKINKE